LDGGHDFVFVLMLAVVDVQRVGFHFQFLKYYDVLKKKERSTMIDAGS
jgi:hypothetical protein